MALGSNDSSQISISLSAISFDSQRSRFMILTRCGLKLDKRSILYAAIGSYGTYNNSCKVSYNFAVLDTCILLCVINVLCLAV